MIQFNDLEILSPSKKKLTEYHEIVTQISFPESFSVSQRENRDSQVPQSLISELNLMQLQYKRDSLLKILKTEQTINSTKQQLLQHNHPEIPSPEFLSPRIITSPPSSSASSYRKSWDTVFPNLRESFENLRESSPREFPKTRHLSSPSVKETHSNLSSRSSNSSGSSFSNSSHLDLGGQPDNLLAQLVHEKAERVKQMKSEVAKNEDSVKQKKKLFDSREQKLQKMKKYLDMLTEQESLSQKLLNKLKKQDDELNHKIARQSIEIEKYKAAIARKQQHQEHNQQEHPDDASSIDYVYSPDVIESPENHSPVKQEQSPIIDMTSPVSSPEITRRIIEEEEEASYILDEVEEAQEEPQVMIDEVMTREEVIIDDTPVELEVPVPEEVKEVIKEEVEVEEESVVEVLDEQQATQPSDLWLSTVQSQMDEIKYRRSVLYGEDIDYYTVTHHLNKTLVYSNYIRNHLMSFRPNIDDLLNHQLESMTDKITDSLLQDLLNQTLVVC
jgi:hypothetical protein